LRISFPDGQVSNINFKQKGEETLRSQLTNLCQMRDINIDDLYCVNQNGDNIDMNRTISDLGSKSLALIPKSDPNSPTSHTVHVTGGEVVDWIVSNDMIKTHDRSEAIAIAQKLFDIGLLQPFNSKAIVFKDGPATYIWKTFTKPQSENHTPNVPKKVKIKDPDSHHDDRSPGQLRKVKRTHSDMKNKDSSSKCIGITKPETRNRTLSNTSRHPPSHISDKTKGASNPTTLSSSLELDSDIDAFIDSNDTENSIKKNLKIKNEWCTDR